MLLQVKDGKSKDGASLRSAGWFGWRLQAGNIENDETSGSIFDLRMSWRYRPGGSSAYGDAPVFGDEDCG